VKRFASSGIDGIELIPLSSCIRNAAKDRTDYKKCAGAKDGQERALIFSHGFGKPPKKTKFRAALIETVSIRPASTQNDCVLKRAERAIQRRP
jgi:hypothetical protein